VTSDTLDPARADQVADAVVRYARQRFGDEVRLVDAPAALGRGFSSFIYAFRLAGGALPPSWCGQLVLRVLPNQAAGAVMERETAIQRFVAGHGYPVLAPLAVEATGDTFGLPFMILPRVMRGTMLDRVSRNPLTVPRLLAAMGDTHVALHRVPIDGCPLAYDAPLVDRRIADWHARLEFAGTDELVRGLAWLDAHADRVRHEDPAICHNDFHPMNLLVEDGGRLTVIDWGDAALGDRHHDVARTVTLLWFAQIAATSRIERLLLLAVRRFMRRRYLAAYTRHLPVDPVRLRYWEAAHAYNAWLQLVELERRGAAAPESKLEMVQQIPDGMVDQLRRYFWRHAT
jgi:aminoglycoside phosphotransferase (APT) family kinase protein